MSHATRLCPLVQLKVNGDGPKGTFNPVAGSTPLTEALELQTPKLYVGGVPPGFERSQWPQLTFVPLMGCVRDVLVDTAQNLRSGNSTGVTNGCTEQVGRRRPLGRDGRPPGDARLEHALSGLSGSRGGECQQDFCLP